MQAAERTARSNVWGLRRNETANGRRTASRPRAVVARRLRRQQRLRCAGRQVGATDNAIITKDSGEGIAARQFGGVATDARLDRRSWYRPWQSADRQTAPRDNGKTERRRERPACLHQRPRQALDRVVRRAFERRERLSFSGP